MPTRQVSGGGTLQSTMILREIEILVNSEVVRKYKFSYFLDLYTHLNIVNEYDQAGTMVSSSMIKWGDRGPLYSLINQPDLDLADSDKELIGDFNGDGKYDLIVFPDKLTYLPTDTWTIYLQEDGEYVQAADGLLGDYFKSMITGDINNDGIDEFIFKFHNNMAPGFTRFRTYNFGNNTMQFLQTIFDYTSTESGIAVQLADFDGNGVVDYLFTEGDNDVKSIIGLVSTVPLLYQPDLVFISDFNGDGRSDIATVDGNYLNVYKYDLLSTQFIKIITNYAFTYYDKIFPGDFNGDGLTDILTVDNGINIPNCFTDQVKTKILLSTGSTFINVDGPAFYQYLCNVPDDPQTEQTIASQWDVGFIINDLNHDGKSDMLATTSVHQVTYLGGGILNEYDEYFHDVYLSSGLAFQHYDIDVQGLLFASHPYDIDFDGVTDFSLIFEGEESRSANFLVDDIRNFALGITNNANLKVSFGYESLMDSNVYYEEEEQFPANVKKISLPARLLSSILVVDKNLQRNLDHKKFRYSNLKVHTQGKGILGFTSMSIKDLMSSDSSIVHYELDPTYYVPFLEETKIYKNNTLVSSTENTNLFIPLDNGKRFATYTSEAINSDFIDNTGQYQLMSLDTDGNITVKEVGYLNSAGDTIKTVREQYSSFDTFGNPGSITVICTNSDSTITRQKTMAYNSSGQLTSSTELFGSSPSVISSFTYDNFGNLLTNSILCDGDSRTNSYVYEPIKARFITQSTNSLGQTTLYDLDSSTGLPYKVTDHNNLSTFYKYDNIGRTFRITSPDSTVTNITRGWSNNALGLGELYYEQVSMAGKPTEISYYDISGKELRSKVESFDGRFLVSDVEYDSLGRLTKKYLPYFEGDARPQYTTFSYDTFNRPSTETVTPNNLVTVYSYSPLKTSMTQAGRSYETEYDAAGMKTKVTEPGGTINYKYNPEGKTIEIESPSGSTFIEYDAYGNQKKLIDLDAGNIEYIYNGLGMLLEKTDAKGNKVIIDHDTGGRTVSETCNTGLTKSYEYFPTSGMLKRTFTSEGAESTYTYDNYLRVLSIIQKVDDQNTFTRTFEYNARGELIKTITNSIVTETYTYNARGYQDQILVNGSLVWKAYSQNKYGIIDNFKLRNNTENTILTYDQYGFPESIQTIGATTLQNWTYSFNPLTGNMTSRSGLKSNGTIASENYTYDNQNRLLTYGIGQNVMTMSYDTTNILYKSDVGEYNYGISAHAPESITNPTLLLDALPDQLVTYTVFDKIKTLTHTVDSLTVKNLSWIYGPDDQRIKQVYKLNSQTLSTKYYAFRDYEKEITPQGFRELYYINSPSGTVAIIEIKPDSVNYFYLHTDLLGSFDVITKANGSIKERNNFDPWGRRRNPIDWSYNSVVHTLFAGRGFTGHEHLIEFDLINMNGRVYDPLLAMFLSPDNFIQATDRVQNFNRYAYCLNNPLIYTDPDGEFFFSLFLGPIGAIIDAACWGAVINGGFYAASTAITGQKWDWGQFGKSMAVGAISGGVGAGAGMLTQGLKVYGAIPGALVKGTIQGTAGGIAGGFSNVIMENDWDSFGSGFAQGFGTGFVLGGISGGIEGFKNAQSVGANPWSGKLYSNQTPYSTTLKSGIPLQPDPSKNCYAYSDAYADAGHGNRSAADFISAAGNADGADAGQIFNKVDPSNFNWSQRISGSQWDNVGGSLQMGKEILGTTSRGGVNHWVNLVKLTTADKWRIIGGGWKRVLFSTSVWDPISGYTVNGPVNFFSIVSLF